MVSAVAVMMMTTGGGGGGGGEALRTNSRRAVLKIALPGAALFTYAGVASAAGPKSPHRSRWTARPWTAAVPEGWPAVLESPHPSARPSCHADSLSAIGGLSRVHMSGQALLLMRLQDHVPIEDVGGALRKGDDQVLVGAGYHLFDDPGLCLGKDAYGIRVPTEVARDHARGTGADMALPGCGRGRGGGSALLTLGCGQRRRWQAGRRRLTPAAQFPAAMARASGQMKPVVLDSPYALPSSSSEWPPRGGGGEGAFLLPPLFSGLRGGSIGECLRKVLIRKQGVVQSKFLGCWLVDVASR